MGRQEGDRGWETNEPLRGFGANERPPAMGACLLVPHFALRVAVLERPELDGAPLVLGPPAGGRSIVLDATPEAARRGIRAGQTVREATALCPEAVVLAPNPVRETDVAARLLERLERLSPNVETDADVAGCWCIDLAGLERHLGPAEEAAKRLLAAAPAILRPRVGVAPGKFAARLAAGQAAPGGTRSVSPKAVRLFLAELAVSWLPLPSETIHRFEAMGLRTLGMLAALPGAKVAARFGPEGRRAWELAGGHDDEPVRPRPRDPTVSERLDLPAPATSRETLLLALDRLVWRAFGRPILRGRAVRQARLRLRLEGGRSWEKSFTLREPSGEKRLRAALRYRLAALELLGPVEALGLRLSGLTAEGGRQEVFAFLRPGRISPFGLDELTEAARHLKQRYGASPLYRIVEVEPWSRIPERRHALLSFDP